MSNYNNIIFLLNFSFFLSIKLRSYLFINTINVHISAPQAVETTDHKTSNHRFQIETKHQICPSFYFQPTFQIPAVFCFINKTDLQVS